MNQLAGFAGLMIAATDLSDINTIESFMYVRDDSPDNLMKEIIAKADQIVDCGGMVISMAVAGIDQAGRSYPLANYSAV